MLSLLGRLPLLAYFAGAYAFAALALAVIGLPRLSDGGSRSMVSLFIFPVIVIGAGLTGFAMTAATGGRSGLRELQARLWRWRVPAQWYAVLLIPPAGILAVLTGLRMLVSPIYTPEFLAFGFGIGAVAGFFEEIGWTGFAYPRLRARFGALQGALLLGLAWGLWHLPVLDSMGAASPHGRYWPAFFAAFIALVAGIRVLIAWVFVNTGSLLLAQLMHASSTGFLVVLSPPRVTAGQEALWYFLYAALVWLLVAILVAVAGGGLAQVRHRNPAGAVDVAGIA